MIPRSCPVCDDDWWSVEAACHEVREAVGVRCALKKLGDE